MIKPPIYSGVKGFISKQKIMFTTPGHNGKVILKSRNFCKLDAASSFETDNLDTPKGYILDSEYQLMKMYKTSHSYYITNGTSCGILAMINSVLNPGDKIIIDRASHKSVIDAVIINRLVPIFADREFNSELGFFGGIDLFSLERTMAANPDAKAVFITSPTYYGVVSDMEIIAELAYKYKMLLLADESHGAHFPMCEEFPKSALEAGADMVVHNAGETLGSMSGGALLHVNNDTVDLNRVRQTLYTYQSPEASNAYLCALENSIYYVYSSHHKYTKLLKEINRCSSIVNDGTDIIWYVPSNDGKYSVFANDKTRIVLNFAKIGMTGAEAAGILRTKCGIEPEMAFGDNLVLVASIFNSTHDIRRLTSGIMSIYKSFLKKRTEPYELPEYRQHINTDVTLVCPPSNTLQCASDWAGADNVRGMICKRTVYSYPTYIPLIIPGERITEEHLACLDAEINGGAALGGIAPNGTFEVVDMSYAFKI